jgi:hypothetical protein
LWENTTELTIPEKFALVEIDSYSPDPTGVVMTPHMLALSMGVTDKEAKELIVSLQEKGAIETSYNENGQVVMKALLYKESYSGSGKAAKIEEKPKFTVDYDYIAEQWGLINPNLPPITRFTPKRKQKLRTMMANADISVDGLIKAFKIIAASGFLQGRTTNWSCTFDWLCRDANNVTKVLEGHYCKDFFERQAYDNIMKGTTTEVGGSNQQDDIYK